jgi:autotransporter-associated beta strand protein
MTIVPMKSNLTRVWTLSILTSLVVVLPSPAADRTWNGGGGNDFWSTPANWGGTAPVAGDALFFGGSIRTSPNNDFPPGTIFGGIAINNPASAFTLRGNGITLGGSIVDQMPLVPQTNLLALSLNAANRTVNVVTNGLLTLAGTISGAGGGLTKTGGGVLTLSANNTFSGVVTIDDGVVSIASDANLGAAPGSATPGKIVINNGALRTTASFTLNANRGIGVGDGTIDVPVGRTVTYGGVIANNGAGNLSKLSFGGLTLSGANTYTGNTAVKNGTWTLDFAAGTAPANNIISSSSHLVLGGENAGLGTTNFSALIVNGKAGTASSQTFNGTTIDIGAQVVRANSGAGGSANIHLGALIPLVGGDVTFVPPGLTGGAGNITTTTANENGILGGWALIGDGTQLNGMTIGTNWAKVDASGNIVNYDMASYVKSTGGDIQGTVTAQNNLLIDDTSGTAGSTVQFAPDGAGALIEVNTINIRKSQPWTLRIGTGNTVRLGRYGSIFKSDVSTHVWTMGQGDGGADLAGSQDFAGTLTAGGADNTPGVIIFNLNQSSQGNTVHHNCYAKITDNGTAPVAVIKAGSAPFKLGGHNTYSGGTYMIQGRIQLGGGFVGTANPDGFGSGPVYVFPGAYLYLNPNPTPGAILFTNELFIAGNGTQPEPLGAIRFQAAGWDIAVPVNLIGDATIGGNNGRISGKITGPFNLTIGSGATVQGSCTFANPENDWRGDTIMQARSGQSGSFFNSASEVIPNGLGFGNVTMLGIGTITWNLNGFTETVNGLSTSGNAANCFILNNNVGTNAVLTLGDYDQAGTFGGAIQNGAGVLALTKIGGGRQTLTGNNTYTGPTAVNGGTLALTGAGSIASSAQITINGGTLDVSELSAGFSYGSVIDINNGTLAIRNTSPAGINTLIMADARVRVASLGATPVVAGVTTLTTGGGANYVDIGNVGTINAYPATFTIIKYTGTIGGAGFNFQLGDVPTPSTVGYVTNNEANSSVDLVLLDGPKPLTWTGLFGSAWDIDTTMNWLAFGITPSVYLDVDSVRFEDSAVLGTVDLTTTLRPGAVVVSNDTRTYTFTGAGKISGPTTLTKDGPGTLILANSGTNDFFGPVSINTGTVQVGNGGAVGNLSAGSVVNNGRLLFNRSDDITVANPIAGGGLLEHGGPGILTLAGDNSFTGAVLIAHSTLKPARANALGTSDGITTVAYAATLDVNGQNLTSEPVTVSGNGVGGLGAIVNSGPEQQSALRNVTLAGDVVFGGSQRWDIRNTGGTASLLSGGQPFKVTKVGSNQVSLVGASVDTELGEVEIVEGTFSVQTTTTGLGDIFSSVLVHGGATLGLFNLNPNALNKSTSLQDGARVFNESGMSLVSGAITLSGSNTFNTANAGTSPSLVLQGSIGGDGTLVKVGSGPLVIAAGAGANHTGPTYVNAGSLLVDGTVQDSPITVAGGTLGGAGSVNSPVLISATGRLAPGNLSSATAVLNFENELTLQGTTVMDVNKASGTISGDRVGGFSTLTYGGTLQLTLSGDPLAAGDELFLFGFATASGAFTSITPATPAAGLVWDTSRLTVDGVLKVVSPAQFEFGSVTVVGQNLVFTGGGGPASTEYRVLTSTDLAVPVVNWESVATNVFDANGNFNFSLPLDPAPHRFYILSY